MALYGYMDDRERASIDATAVVASNSGMTYDAVDPPSVRGHSSFTEGVIMQRPGQPGYCRRNVYVIDDLR